MKIRISTRNSLDTIIIALLFIQVAILNFLNMAGFGIKLICILIIIRFLLSVWILKCIDKFIVKNLFLFILLFLIFVISAKMGHTYQSDIFMINILAIIYSLFPMIYFAYIINKKYSIVFHIINKSFWIINIYYFINIIVSIIQTKVEGFMAGISNWTNSMNEDLISGLFGYSSTHQFGLFSCFVIIYNLYYANFLIKNRRYKNFLYAYIVILNIFLLIISIINDNKAVYIELSMFLMFYLYLTGFFSVERGKIEKDRFRFLIAGIFAILTLIVFYNLIPTIRTKVYDNFMYAIVLLINAAKSTSVLGYGSADRVYMIIYAFERYNAMLFGFGTGSYVWNAGNALGFKHFGQADLGAFLCLAGIWFTIIIWIIMVLNYSALVFTNKDKNIKHRFLLAGFILFILFYTQAISINTINIILLFIAGLFGVISREWMIKKKG